MSNEQDKRPLSQRMKDGNRIVESLQPSSLPPTVKLSPEQIEAIAEAVANKVVAALKAKDDAS
jgi:hypothetical protein